MKKITSIILTIAISACALLGITSCSNKSIIQDAIAHNTFDNVDLTYTFKGTGHDNIDITQHIKKANGIYYVKNSTGEKYYYDSANGMLYWDVNGQQFYRDVNSQQFHSVVSTTDNFWHYKSQVEQNLLTLWPDKVFEDGTFITKDDGTLIFTAEYNDNSNLNQYEFLWYFLGHYSGQLDNMTSVYPANIDNLKIIVTVKDGFVVNLNLKFVTSYDDPIYNSTYELDITVSETGEGVEVELPEGCKDWTDYDSLSK